MIAALAAMYDDEVGCILIDEPEVSLHPQLQSFIYSEMVKVAGDPSIPGEKLIILSTHSTEFINFRTVDELASFIFFSDVYDEPKQITPSDKIFENKKLKSFLLRIGHEYKLALFCKRPILVEGPSDKIICHALCRKLNLNLEAAGSSVLPVSGKGQIPTVIKLMRQLGKQPIVLADADAFVDELELINSFASLPPAIRMANEIGHRNAQEFASSIHSDFVQLVEQNWQDIEERATPHSYWAGRSENDERMAKRRAAFATLLTFSEKDFTGLNNSNEWKNMQMRLLSLLELLAHVGCFVLRKGTIEDYYGHSVDEDKDGKLDLAVEETYYLLEMSNRAIENAYGDVVAAIRFAAQTEQIDEGKALRDIVLAVVSPTLANLEDFNSDEIIKTLCKELVGNRASLFDFEIDKENGLQLVVNLSSSILEVQGFPLRIKVGENPIEAVNRQMQIG